MTNTVQLARADLVPRLKWALPWAGIAFWLSFLGLNCAQMAPGRAESDFGLQGWIDTLGLKQILLIFSLWRAAREKLSEVQLLRLGAPSHTSAPFYLRTWNLRAYARKNYAKVEIHLMVICGRLFCRTFKPSPRSAFQQDRRISRTFCVVNTTRELDKKRRGRWKQEVKQQH